MNISVAYTHACTHTRMHVHSRKKRFRELWHLHQPRELPTIPTTTTTSPRWVLLDGAIHHCDGQPQGRVDGFVQRSANVYMQGGQWSAYRPTHIEYRVRRGRSGYQWSAYGGQEPPGPALEVVAYMDIHI